MTEVPVSIGKYCQFIIILTKYWGNIIIYIPPQISGNRLHPFPPLNFPVMPAGLPVEVIVKVPSRYYRVPRYFFTVLTVAHNQWYRPTLVPMLLSTVSELYLVKLGMIFMAFTAFAHNTNTVALLAFHCLGPMASTTYRPECGGGGV